MSILTDQELSTLQSSIANFFHTAVGKPEEFAALSLEKSYDIANEKVASGDWSGKRAAAYVETAQKAAAAVYATAKSLKHRQTKLAFVSIVDTVSGIVNARVGFKLLP